MIYSAELACMAPVPEALFIEACERAVANNLEFVPPYGSGGALYLRPLLLGTGPEIGLYPAPEFTFIVSVIPGKFMDVCGLTREKITMWEFFRISS